MLSLRGRQSKILLNTCKKSIYQRCRLAEILIVISFAHCNSADLLYINASGCLSGDFDKMNQQKVCILMNKPGPAQVGTISKAQKYQKDFQVSSILFYSTRKSKTLRKNFFRKNYILKKMDRVAR